MAMTWPMISSTCAATSLLLFPSQIMIPPYMMPQDTGPKRLEATRLADTANCRTWLDMIRSIYDMPAVKYPVLQEPEAVLWPPPHHHQGHSPPPLLQLTGSFRVVSTSDLVQAAFEDLETANQAALQQEANDEAKKTFAMCEGSRLNQVAMITSFIFQPDLGPPDVDRYYFAMYHGVQNFGGAVPVAYTYLDFRGHSTVDGTPKKGPNRAYAFLTTGTLGPRCFVRFLFMANLDVCEEIQTLAAHGLEVAAALHATASRPRRRADSTGRRNKAIAILRWVFQTAYEFSCPYVLVTNIFKNIWFHVENGIIRVGPTMTPSQRSADGSPPVGLGLLHALLAMGRVAALATIKNPDNRGCILQVDGTIAPNAINQLIDQSTVELTPRERRHQQRDVARLTPSSHPVAPHDALHLQALHLEVLHPDEPHLGASLPNALRPTTSHPTRKKASDARASASKRSAKKAAPPRLPKLPFRGHTPSESELSSSRNSLVELDSDVSQGHPAKRL